VKAFLSASKAEWHSSEKCQGYPCGKTREWDCDFGISINETMVEVGKAEEGLNVLDLFVILAQSWIIWTLYGHGEAFG